MFILISEQKQKLYLLILIKNLSKKLEKCHNSHSHMKKNVVSYAYITEIITKYYLLIIYTISNQGSNLKDH